MRILVVLSTFRAKKYTVHTAKYGALNLPLGGFTPESGKLCSHFLKGRPGCCVCCGGLRRGGKAVRKSGQ